MPKSAEREIFIFRRSLKIGYRMAKPMLLVMLLAPIVVYFLVPNQDRDPFFYSWLIAAVLLLLYRASITQYFNTYPIAQENDQKAYALMTFGATATGVLWGAGAVGLISDITSHEHYILTFIVAIYIISGPNILFMVPTAMAGLLFGLWAPTVGRYLASGEPLGYIIALTLTVLTIISLSSALSRRKDYLDLLNLEMEKEELVNRLREERDASRTLNEQLNKEINHRKAAQKALQSSQVRLIESKAVAESANQAKNDFLASMSHELRTPLNAIIGYSDIMQRKLFGPLSANQYDDYPRLINDSGNHLLKLVDSLLDITQLEGDANPDSETVLTPSALIKGVNRLSRIHLFEKNQTIIDDIAPNLPSFTANPLRLEQVLYNFVKNAIAHSPQNGTIVIGSFIDAAGELVFYVNDYGKGMKPEQQRIALTPLERSPDLGGEGGGGLGLAIAKQIISHHGGDIRLQSDYGEGTTIAFTIPQNRFASAI